MYCKSCGTQNTDGTKFCLKCGAPLSIAPTYPTQPIVPSQPMSYPKQNSSYNRTMPVTPLVNSNSKASPKKNNIPLIIACAVAGVAIIALIIVSIFAFGKKDEGNTDIIGGTKAEKTTSSVEYNDKQDETETETETEVQTTEPPKVYLTPGDIITLGNYEQDTYSENGREAIEWYVLTVEGDKALIISRYILDTACYHTSNSAVTWETCSLRKWLNNDFMNTAFSTEEQKRIIETTLSNPDNSKYGIDGGNDTVDKIFLLSEEECKLYLTETIEETIGTAYAKSKDLEDYDQCHYWWLRSPGKDVNYASDVSSQVWNYGAGVAKKNYGVRPAMWITIE